MKIKIDWKKAAQITLSFVKPLVKPFIAALVGGGVVSGLSGCSSKDCNKGGRIQGMSV